jgi:hypothetical protein
MERARREGAHLVVPAKERNVRSVWPVMGKSRHGVLEVEVLEFWSIERRTQPCDVANLVRQLEAIRIWGTSTWLQLSVAGSFHTVTVKRQ